MATVSVLNICLKLSCVFFSFKFGFNYRPSF
nr:MAG TPA: hypothetical protein [Caudoviricetes sp.]